MSSVIDQPECTVHQDASFATSFGTVTRDGIERTRSPNSDLPRAVVLGTPARDLPQELPLLKGFVCRAVPTAEPADVRDWNVLYRPFSTRSFLRQYLDWLQAKGATTSCTLSSNLTVNAVFDPETQRYTTELECSISDVCGAEPCHFLQLSAIKPEEASCQAVRLLCDVKGQYGLCQTGDEAMLLRRYLSINGAQHYPMLIPQPSLLKGKKRPDFVCFVPLSRFQYQKIAVLVDRPGKDPRAGQKETWLYESLGFVVKRIEVEPTAKSYFKEARALSNWIESVAAGGTRPPRCAFMKELQDPRTWATALADSPEAEGLIREGKFPHGSIGEFLQDTQDYLDNAD